MSVDVVCLGILVADVIARPVETLPERGSLGFVDAIELHGGGCALNTASALTRLGLRAAVVGEVGDDAFGDFLLRLLDERGVDRRGVLRRADAATSASVALVAGDGERTFLHVPGANDRVDAADLDPELLYAGRWLHLAGTGVLARLDGGPVAALLAEARRRGLGTSLDTAWDASGRWRIGPALAYADVACPSLAEARAISGEHEPAAVAAWFRRRGVATIVLTMGAEGCYAAGEGFAGHVPAPHVDAVDGTGAGDAFAAGLIYACLAGRPLEDSLRFASAAGALATTALGAYAGITDAAETLLTVA